jgi:hypothetical protein
MSAKVIVVDPSTGIEAAVADGIEENALVVATRPLKTLENSVQYFSNDTYGVDMNQNAAFGGTPVRIHDGLDSVLWTGSNISGTAVFNSTDYAYAGSQSISFAAWALSGNTAQIAKGSSQSLTGYTAITMWIFVANNWSTDIVTFYGWDTGTGTMVGSSISLSDYAPVRIFATWHRITIPLEDLDLVDATVDSFRFEYDLRVSTPANFYIDELILQETGSSIKYELKPTKGTWLHVVEFTFSMADAMAGTLADGTMPAIAYDQTLGLTLTAGINYQREQRGKNLFTISVKNLMGLMEIAGTTVTGLGSDGTNTWLTVSVKHMEPLLLKSEDSDILSFTINDDMTDLLHFRITAGCKIENR